MNCYTGLAKRLVKSYFPEVKLSQVIPVPQLEPLDAKNIIKCEVKDNNTTKACFALSEEVLKPISNEEAWEAALAWAEAKAQERETASTKEASHTDTDESYDSDDFEDDNKDADEEDNNDDKVKELVRRIVADWVVESKKYRAATLIQAAARGRAARAWNAFISAPVVSNNDNNGSAFVTKEVVTHLLWTVRLFGNRISAATVAVTAITALAETRRRDKIMDNEVMVTAARTSVVEWVAAAIIQAAARGRAVRAWNAITTDVVALEKQLAEQWDASPKYVRAWIKLAEKRRYGHRFWHIHRM
jgi:hypothetical protein